MNLDEIKAAALAAKAWGDCNKAWLDTSEDDPCSVVGGIDEDGNKFPVAFIDCEQYYESSVPLAKFYATANPEAVLEMCAEIERLQSLATTAMEQHEIVGGLHQKSVKEIERSQKVIKGFAGAVERKHNKIERNREVMAHALYVIEAWERDCNHDDYWRDRDDAITALKVALT